MKRATTLLSLLFALCSTAAHADEPKPIEVRLESTINQVLDAIFEKQEVPDLVSKRNKILTLIEENFPLDVIVQRAFGRNWKQFTEGQKTELITLTSDLILNIYTRDFNDMERPQMTFLDPIELTTAKVEIPTTIQLSNLSINLSYRLANRATEGWQIYDILVEGRSIVSNYRTQFDEHFQKKGPEELLQRLRNKLVEFK